MLKLTQQRREIKCPQRAYSCFPTPLKTLSAAWSTPTTITKSNFTAVLLKIGRLGTLQHGGGLISYWSDQARATDA